MKTIKEHIEKWNEMYDLVIAGAPDANNDSWKRVAEVFMIDGYRKETRMPKMQQIINTFTQEWAALTEDDMAQDNDCKVWMKCIGCLLSQSGQHDYAFYIYKGEVGVLCNLPSDVIKIKGYDDYNGIAFVPGYAMSEVLNDTDCEEPNLTNEEDYSGYCGCSEIGIQECRNMENDERMELNWWTNDWVKSDLFSRMFGKNGEFTCKLRDLMGDGKINEQQARKLWAEEQQHYEDPISCGDYSFDAIFNIISNH